MMEGTPCDIRSISEQYLTLQCSQPAKPAAGKDNKIGQALHACP